MRRSKNQDKYLKFILENKMISKTQKLWLCYWFLDRNGYPKNIGLMEQKLGLSRGKTKLRITDPLQEMQILTLVGEKPQTEFGYYKSTPIFDFTKLVEDSVREVARHEDVDVRILDSLTRHFYEDDEYFDSEDGRQSHNNKVPKQTKEFQSIDDFSSGEVLDLNALADHSEANGDTNKGEGNE